MLKTLKRKITLKLFSRKKSKSKPSRSGGPSLRSKTDRGEDLGKFLAFQDDLFLADNIYSWLNVRDATSLSMVCSSFRKIFTSYYGVNLRISEHFKPQYQVPFQRIKNVIIEVETPKDYATLLKSNSEDLSILNWSNVKSVKIVLFANSRSIASNIGSLIQTVFLQRQYLERLIIQNKIAPSDVSSMIGASIYNNIQERSIGKMITNLPSNIISISKLCNNLHLGSRFHISESEVNFQNLEDFKCTLESNNIQEFNKIFSNPTFHPNTLELDLDISITNFLPNILNLLTSTNRVMHANLSGQVDGRLIFHELKHLPISENISITIQDPNPHKISNFEKFNKRNRTRCVSIEANEHNLPAISKMLKEQSPAMERLFIVCDCENTMSQVSIAIYHTPDSLSSVLYMAVKRPVDISSRSRSHPKYVSGLKIQNRKSKHLSRKELRQLENLPSLVLK